MPKCNLTYDRAIELRRVLEVDENEKSLRRNEKLTGTKKEAIKASFRIAYLVSPCQSNMPPTMFVASYPCASKNSAARPLRPPERQMKT